MEYVAYFDASYKEKSTVVSHYITSINNIFVYKNSYFVHNDLFTNRGIGIEEFSMLELLKLLKKMDIDNVIIRGDYKSIFLILKGRATSKSKHISPVITEIKKRLKEFKKYKIEWTPRKLNNIADGLCRQVRKSLIINESVHHNNKRVQNIAKEFATKLLAEKRTCLNDCEKTYYFKQIEQATNLDTIKLRVQKHKEYCLNQNLEPKYRSVEDVALEMIDYILSLIKDNPNKKVKFNSYLNNIYTI